MSVETFIPSAMQFTQGAANKVKNLVDEEGNPRLKLRVFVTGGGCSGFQYPIVILGLGYCGHKTRKNFSKLTKLRLGHTAEIATANELIGLQALGYQVFHDIQADGFNIDHLAIGKNGVFAIETKGRHKRKRDSKSTSATQGKDYQLFYKDGRLCFPSWTETKPIEQAERQAKWVSQWLTKATGQPVFTSPVLVFPGWYVSSQTRPPFPILNHKQLVKTLPSMRTQSLSQQQVDAIVYQVAQRCLSKSEVGK